MKDSLKKLGSVAAVCAAVLGIEAYGASSVLLDYFEAAAGFIPNKLELSVYEEMRYNDNIHDAVKGEERESAIFKTGLKADWTRTTGSVSYGVLADVGYEYYTKDSHDMNQFVWNITPALLGKLELSKSQNIRLGFHSGSKIEPINHCDHEYSRNYTNGLDLTYDLLATEKAGIALTGEWENKYYPQSEFKSFSKNTYGFGINPYYKFTEKVKGGLKLEYEEVHYRNSKQKDDYYKETANIFADYRINTFFTITAEAGAERLAFEGISEDCRQDRDFKPDYAITVRYLPLVNVAFDLRAKEAREDTNGFDVRGIVKVSTYDLTARWDVSPKLTISDRIGYEIRDEKDNDTDTAEFFNELRANYDFNTHLNVYAAYKYNNVQFSYSSDDDYAINEVMLGASYKF